MDLALRRPLGPARPEPFRMEEPRAGCARAPTAPPGCTHSNTAGAAAQPPPATCAGAPTAQGCTHSTAARAAAHAAPATYTRAPAACCSKCRGRSRRSAGGADAVDAMPADAAAAAPDGHRRGAGCLGKGLSAGRAIQLVREQHGDSDEGKQIKSD
eukprot:960099-Pelagomonas_calceolata.AAC.1